MKKVLWLTNIPSPYRVDFFNELGKFCPLTVLFEKASSDERDDNWKNYSFSNFRGVILKGFAVSVNTAISIKFRSFVKAHKEDIIVVGNPATPTGLLAILYMQLHKIPYVVESDGAFPLPAVGLKGNIKKILYSKAQYCFTTSNVGIDYFLNYGVKKECIYKYPFSSIKESYIESSVLKKDQKYLIRESLGIHPGKMVLSVGQFIHRKGFDVLLDASLLLPKDIHFFVVGNEPTKEYLDFCKINNLDNVHFVNFMKPSQLKLWYLASDIFVLPTREDIWGLVVNEALACGLPVITTEKCVSGLEMINQKGNGYIIKVDSPNELVDSVNSLYSDLEYNSKCENALRVAKEYTIESMAKRHIELFNQLF